MNEEPIQINTDLGEVHHNYCETCKDNLDKKPGDLCPLCDSPIDLVVKMF